MSEFLLAAGGTGGHMVPAHAVARELERRGHHVTLVTDRRGAKIPGLFTGNNRHIIEAASIGSNPLKWPGALWKIQAGRRQAGAIIRAVQPAAVVGFGGYPVLPAMAAALRAKLPTLICEQNAVLGRVNRLIARKVDMLAASFPDTERVPPMKAVVVTGNPVRANVAALSDRPFPDINEFCPIRLLVLGGSLGASVLSDVVPRGLALLPQALKERLQVLQQVREADFRGVCQAYEDAGIPAEVSTYVEDVPGALARTHLFIGRSGASTVSELTAAGRPAILVPLPIATDDHQAANTRELVQAGGAVMIRQPAFTPEGLARQVEIMLERPDTIINAAARARSVGRPDATARVADLAERLAGLSPPNQEYS